MPPAHSVEVPLFAGHGSSSLYASHTRELALHDAKKSTTAQFLLASCHTAFLQELATLSPEERFLTKINLDDFSNPDSLLTAPTDHYLHNAILSGSALFLTQSLRYLAFLHDHNAFINSPKSSFIDILSTNLQERVGILGFSSGILPAIVVASAPSAPLFISHAVEAYRLALWIGVRVQIYRESLHNRHCGTIDPAASWGLVVLGMDCDGIEQTISSMGHQTTLCVTVVTEEGGVTVSGYPEHLQVFASRLPSHVVTSPTSLETLYHSPVYGAPHGVRDAVLLDINRRNIRFPTFSDLHIPVRSTWDGSLLWRDSSSKSLVTKVIDLLLIHRVNWNLVTGALRKSSTPLRFINVGPGAGLCRSMIRTFDAERASMLDLTTATTANGRNVQKQEPIAIIGMAANLPGAPDVASLWKLLEDGINTVTEIPESRFKVTDYEGQHLMGSRTMKARTGNFVSNVDEFDATFFKISPREAKSMDPQQRLLLHASYEALEDAGYVPDSTPCFRRDAFGVFVGAATHDYLQNLRNDIDVYYSTGTLKAFLSGRISYAMQFSGPSVVVDTACSSSALAIHQGCRALMNGDCNAALVGGVNAISSPDMYLGLDRGHFLSPTGQCKPFDATADGYSRSEGVAMFVLKRLSDAIAENDRVLGVIRGVEVNQSGLAHSITHPHAETQASLFKQLLDNSGVPSEHVNVIEAHGTGTRAGDPNELKSIRSVFATKRTAANPLHITSIKANLGHLEAASGAASLAKLLLMLQHKSIPPQISLKTLNPSIAPLEQDNTVIDTRPTHWMPSPSSQKRFAVLNNFGASGSNSALLLEEHLSAASPDIHDVPLVFGLSAKTEVAIRDLRNHYLKWLQRPENKSVSLSDVAYTSTARRQVYRHRLAFSVSDLGDLQQKLARADIVSVDDKPAQVAFVFSGQSGQYLGMGRALYESSPMFRNIVNECDAHLRWNGFSSVLPIITTETGSIPDPATRFETYQTSQFVLQLALAKLWMSWGVRASAVIGHSLGEYAALVIAGVLTWQDALTIVAHRARLMVQHCAPNTTGMVAVNLGPQDVLSAISASPQFSLLTISCYNTPNDCVVSGPIDQIAAFKPHVEHEYHCRSTILNVPFGYHSAAMTPILGLLRDVCSKVRLHPPKIPIVSNVFGSVVMPGDFGGIDKDYFARHCAEPVLFDRGVTALVLKSELPDVDAWIEIGPHATTLPMLKSNASFPCDGLLLPSLRKKQDPWTTLTSCLAQLYLLDVPIMWRAVYSHIPATCISLPSYPFSKRKFWVTYKEDSHAAPTPPTSSIMDGSLGFFTLSRWRQMPSSQNGFVAIFETPISDLADSISGHLVGGMPLCPGSIYTEQVFAGVRLASQHLGRFLDHAQVSIREMEFTKPLVYSDAISQTVSITITLAENQGLFRIGSRSSRSQEEVVHAHGHYRLIPTSQLETKFACRWPVVERQMAAVLDGRNNLLPEVFSSRTIYGVIFPRVVEYTSPYQSIQSLTVDPNGMEARAVVKIPSGGKAEHVVHPVFVDTLLHLAGFVANMHGSPGDAYICSKIGTMKVIADRVDDKATYLVYCSNAWLPDQGVMLCEAWAVKDGQPQTIVAHAKGIHFRRLSLASLQRSLSCTTGASRSRRPSNATRPHTTSIAQQPTVPTIHGGHSNTIQKEVLDIMAETLDMPLGDISPTHDLNSIGADSLMLIELSARIGTAFPSGGLNTQDLVRCSSIRDIVTEISSRVASSASTPTLVQEKLPECERPLSRLSERGDVKVILAQVLGLDASEMADEAELGDLGLDSLTSIEALRALEEAFSIDMPASLLMDHSTPNAIQAFIAQGLQLTAGSSSASLQTEKLPDTPCLSDDGSPVKLIFPSSTDNSPLFLFHDGSGSISYYSRLKKSLDRRTWGIPNASAHSNGHWEDLTQMANHYTSYIIPKISGPILLGGWSFGGVLAYEVAQQLTRRGYTIKGIVLIDSPSPCDHVPLSDSLIDSIVSRIPRISTSGKDLVKQRFKTSTNLLASYHPPMPDVCPPLVLLRSKQGVQFEGVVVPKWLGDRSDLEALSSGWTEFTRQDVKVFDLPGTHFEVFSSENNDQISERLLNACSYLDSLTVGAS